MASLNEIIDYLKAVVATMHNIELEVLEVNSHYASFNDARNRLIKLACSSNSKDPGMIVPLGRGKFNDIFNHLNAPDFVVRVPKQPFKYSKEVDRSKRYDAMCGRIGDDITPGIYTVYCIPYYKINADGTETCNVVTATLMQKLRIFHVNESILEWPLGRNDKNRIAALVMLPLLRMVERKAFHNDLHNENIVLVSDDEENGVKILDFDGGCNSLSTPENDDGALCSSEHLFGEIGPEFLMSVNHYMRCSTDENSIDKWQSFAIMYCKFLRKYFPDQYREIFTNNELPTSGKLIASEITNYVKNNSKCDVGDMRKCFDQSQVYVIANLTITKIIAPPHTFYATEAIMVMRDRSMLEEGLDKDLFAMLIKCLGLLPETRPTTAEIRTMLERFV